MGYRVSSLKDISILVSNLEYERQRKRRHKHIVLRFISHIDIANIFKWYLNKVVYCK